MRGDAQKVCDIELDGTTTTLELIVEDGGDNLHRDDGFWFKPTLRR